MGTINDKIDYLNETKNLIKQAIVNKGQSIQEDDTFRSYAEKIQNITTGIDTSDANALAQDILIDKTAYVNNIKITGTMPNQGELTITPSISEQQKEAGYYSNILIKAVTNEIDPNIVAENIKQGITILSIAGNVIELKGQTKTITPTTEEQIIEPEEDYNALTQITVEGVTNTIDSNIIAENIKKDISILGITGTYEGLDTNSATATADDIMLNKTAYVKGELITGNMEQQSNAICTEDVSASLVTESSEVKIEGRWNGSKAAYIDNTCTLGAKISYTALANVIGLTADKIKLGETILGIEGTYTGEPA